MKSKNVLIGDRNASERMESMDVVFNDRSILKGETEEYYHYKDWEDWFRLNLSGKSTKKSIKN
jgi:hypothetical protein